MCPPPHDGSAADGLSCSLLRFMEGEGRIELLREGIGEFSHRCRNLLNGMKMGIYFVRRAGSDSLPCWWDDVEESYRGIERLFDDLQRIYRPMPLTAIRASFGSLVKDRRSTWLEWFTGRGLGLDLIPPTDDPHIEFDPILISMALDGFVQWRSRTMSRGTVARLRWEADDEVLVGWDETPVEPATQVSERTPDASTPGTERNGDGLALPLLARVLTAHGGCLRSNPGPGFRVDLRWPRSIPATAVNREPAPALAAASRT